MKRWLAVAALLLTAGLAFGDLLPGGLPDRGLPTRGLPDRGLPAYGSEAPPSTYSVTYDANGGTGSTTDPSSPYEETDTVTVVANAFTRTGYTFDHWDTQADDGGTDYAPAATFSMPASNVTLYAQWTVNSYTLTYDGNGEDSGTAPTDASSPYNYAATVTVLGNTGSLAKSGYTFWGWNTAADGTGTGYQAAAEFSMPAANTTLYAVWLSAADAPVSMTSTTSPQRFITLFGIAWITAVGLLALLYAVTLYWYMLRRMQWKIRTQPKPGDMELLKKIDGFIEGSNE